MSPLAYTHMRAGVFQPCSAVGGWPLMLIIAQGRMARIHRYVVAIAPAGETETDVML